MCERASFGQLLVARLASHSRARASRSASARNDVLPMPRVLRCHESTVLSVRHLLSPRLSREVHHRTRCVLSAVRSSVRKRQRAGRIPGASASIRRAIWPGSRTNSIKHLGHCDSVRQSRCERAGAAITRGCATLVLGRRVARHELSFGEHRTPRPDETARSHRTGAATARRTPKLRGDAADRLATDLFGARYGSFRKRRRADIETVIRARPVTGA